MTEDHDDVFRAAYARAPHAGTPPLAHALRTLINGARADGRLDPDLYDRLNHVADRFAAQPRLRPGDLIATHGIDGDIPWHVLEVAAADATRWVRAFGDNRFARDPGDDVLDRSETYDWFCPTLTGDPGGWATTEGVLVYAPLRVTRVVPPDWQPPTTAVDTPPDPSAGHGATTPEPGVALHDAYTELGRTTPFHLTAFVAGATLGDLTRTLAVAATCGWPATAPAIVHHNLRHQVVAVAADHGYTTTFTDTTVADHVAASFTRTP